MTDRDIDIQNRLKKLDTIGRYLPAINIIGKALYFLTPLYAIIILVIMGNSASINWFSLKEYINLHIIILCIFIGLWAGVSLLKIFLINKCTDICIKLKEDYPDIEIRVED